MSFQGDSIFWVEVEKIVPNPYQPRREFDEAKLRELADSIRMYGVLQPLTVTRREIARPDGSFHTEYELIAGERRLRASRLAGLEQVPVIIRSGEQSEQEKLELAIIENLQREDLNAVDRALAFQQLADVFKLSHTDVAKKVGRSREYVSNSIRLLGLPEYMLNSVRTNDINEGHARTLLMLKERPEEQDVLYREIILKKLSVREVERIARKIATDKVRKRNWLNTDSHLIEIEREFTDTLGTRVQIQKTDFGGKLTIDYFTEGDLQQLLALVKLKGTVADRESEVDVKIDEAPVVVQKMSEAVPLHLVEEKVGSEEVSTNQHSQTQNIEVPTIQSHSFSLDPVHSLTEEEMYNTALEEDRVAELISEQAPKAELPVSYERHDQFLATKTVPEENVSPIPQPYEHREIDWTPSVSNERDIEKSSEPETTVMQPIENKDVPEQSQTNSDGEKKSNSNPPLDESGLYSIRNFSL